MREFDFIDKFLKPLAAKDQLGDDCAFFDGYCVSKDVLISGVHFFAGDAPYNLARKALRVNLSDLAASGAKPFGFMLGLALPRGTSEKWLKEFAAGLESDIAKYKIKLLGGDTVYHDGELMISVTVIGKCKKPVLRSGAKLGDNIFVSGNIGDGWLGLQAKLAGKKSGKYIEKYELPEPRVELGIRLPKIANAAIDISDGLLADLGHICDESGLGAEIDSVLIPVSDKKNVLMQLLSGGDDYELLFTSKLEKIKDCYKIGRIVKRKGLYLDRVLIKAKGYEHV